MGSNTFKSPEEIPRSLKDGFFDAIIVLGGGVPITPDTPPLYVESRCKYAAEVYQSSTSTTKKPKILTLSAGTAHLPQLLSSDGLPVWESTASASFLMKKLNVTHKDIYAETTSYDTISNAFFTRTSFCDVAGWKRLLIITSEFHMVRTKLIFDWIMNAPNLKTGNADVSISPPSKEAYELYYLSAPDDGLPPSAIVEREKRELKSADNVKNNLSKNYQSLEDVFHFMTQEHSFYTAGKLVERANQVQLADNAEHLEMLRRSYGGHQEEIKKSRNQTKDGSSFGVGVMFGIVLVAMFQFFTKRGAKIHSK